MLVWAGCMLKISFTLLSFSNNVPYPGPAVLKSTPEHVLMASEYRAHVSRRLENRSGKELLLISYLIKEPSQSHVVASNEVSACT